MNYKIKLIYALIAIFAFTSCNDYLDVKPKTEVARKDLFKTERGFLEALSGVYIAMKGSSLYGTAMTMTTIEHLVSNWDTSPQSTEEKLNNFDYSDESVEGRFSSIYGKAYNVIAQVNAILESVDEMHQKGVFTTPGIYELVKGECLAIRAYCHFDMLRLFGPVPSLAGTETVLPYMKELTTKPIPHISFNAFKTALLSDVNKAVELLAEDPVKSASIKETRRNLNFNYYAGLALKARVHLWFAEKNEAYTAANEVIAAENPDGYKKFPLGTGSDMAEDDLQLTCEHVCGLYAYNLHTISSEQFEEGNLSRGQTLEFVRNHLYESSASDIRSAYLWEVYSSDTKSFCTLEKYKNEKNKSGKKITILPLMRISEMYLIAAECAVEQEVANGLWGSFLKARNLTEVELPVDQAAKELQIVKEYRKEFFAEGQAFFAYKRLNFDKENMLWVPGQATVNYVVPLPKTELISN